MADKVISVDNIKAFWHSQIHDPDKWDLNMKLLRAAGLFAGSIILMRQYVCPPGKNGYVYPSGRCRCL